MTTTHPAGPAPAVVRWRYAAAALAAIGVMAYAVAGPSIWLLNFVHVMAGLLWTGIDLFMGFVIGPILRRLEPAARGALVLRLMPRMLFLMPTLAIVTGTAGFYLAERLGFLAEPFPGRWWIIAALALLGLLTVQGLGLLLPTNLMVFLELRKPDPDHAKIARRMRRYVFVVAQQGAMQVAMIVVMARLVTGG